MKQYFNNLNENYSIIHILKYAVFLATIALLIDKFNLPTNYLFSYDKSFIFVLMFAAVLILILTAIEFNIWEMFKICTINYLDGICVMLLYSIPLYTVASFILVQLSLYKIVVIICVISLSTIILMIRGNRFRRQIKVSEGYKANVIDLREVFNGNFIIEESKVILVNEKDVDYDLLERTSIINQLFNAINKCSPDGRVVISLEGKWGSGKTTIINNVRKKLINEDPNIVIIDEFDPWTYSNQESMLYNMFDLILKKTGFGYSSLSMKQMISNVYETILGDKKTGSILNSLFRRPNEITILKNKINDYLKLCGKKVIFFIDNIDRAESENIILLFKLVGNVFDFERVTYVLSFDDERIKKVFDNDLNIDYKFLKKVIQMQVRVHEIDKIVLEKVFKKCMNNLLVAYGETSDKLVYYDAIINCVCKQTKDIRDFKRFINSAISTIFGENNYLNKRELLAIEYIHLYNFDLYQNIYKNRKFFISHDKMVDVEIYHMSFNKKDFYFQAKAYFCDLFSNEDNNSYIDLLAELFPYVRKYQSNQELEYDGYLSSDNQYPDIVRNQRMCSAKYFDLYFTHTDNDYLLVNKIVTTFVNTINQSSSIDDCESIFNTVIESTDGPFQKEIFERFQFYLEDLNQDCLYNIINVLFNNLSKINNLSVFLGLNARKRVVLIIWELLQKITEEHFENLLEEISKNYESIENISTIFYWFDNDREGKNVEGRKQKWEHFYKKMGEEILMGPINLYEDKYYSPKNIWGLCRLYKDDRTTMNKYIKLIINEKTIFRFIYDIVGLAYGLKYQYYISNENLDTLTTESELDKILEKTQPGTKDEQFILDVYESYKTGVLGDWGKGGIDTDVEKKLML